MDTTIEKKTLKHGDFTGLAANYSKYRPAYSESVQTCLLSLVEVPTSEVDFVDVGAGTGIWTRMMAAQGCRSIVAVEPNDDMRYFGEQDSQGFNIQWRAGSGENTALPDASADIVSMASSFHWVDFEKGTREFYRILKPNGRFVALWNPRLIAGNPLLSEIESKLYELAPHIKRVSSGRSLFTESLSERLWESPYFTDVVYLEGRHVAHLTPEQYVGVWRSVNDIQVQAGPEKFAEFMAYIESRVKGLEYVESAYQTCAWVAKKV